MHVTPAESEVLAALWRRGPLSWADLIDEVKAAQAWGDATIKTLLGRLIRKGAIRSEKVDGRQRYRALVERSAWIDGEVQALADRLFGGDRLALAEYLAAAR
jgi:BlaI family penicillinase repressor